MLKASEILGWAAVFEGYHVKKSEVHGMAQRGGSVESHLRFGKEVFSPLIPEGEADFLVSFDSSENSRLKHFLSPKGTDLIKYLDKAKKTIHDKRYINTFLMGVLSGFLPIKENNWLESIRLVFSNKNLEENTKIFFQGRGEIL